MADAAVSDHAHERPGFFTRWFMSTNHKDIGILYLFTAGLVGLISVAFTVYMRLELMDPGVQYMCREGARLIADAAAECTPDGHLWNVMITGHGVLMMFFVVIPALFGGFGNYFMPLQIGAPDMAFPRLNNLSYWMYVAGTCLAFCSVLRGSGRGPGLDLLSADFGTGRHVGRLRDLRDPRLGCILDPWRDQLHHDLPEHAGTGHDACTRSRSLPGRSS